MSSPSSSLSSKEGARGNIGVPLQGLGQPGVGAPGILPYSEKYEFGGWSLPGHGEAYYDCGSLRYRGCLNTSEHHAGLDCPEREGKAYVQVYRRTCARKECPVCYEAWAGREAARAVYRLEAYGRGKPIHVVASPSKELWGFEHPELRRKLYALLKRAGIRGGSVIFHPFRIPKGKSPFFSPHFHVVGFGWLNFYRGGGKWVVKNLGVRKSLHATLMYQLSHAGVHEAFHVITWFGALAYNKLRIPKFAGEGKPTCPLCHAELVPLDYVGSEGPPLEPDEYWLPGEDWEEKIGRFG